ncbi:MAG TPA: SDR family oxidoreductase [Mycobacteriales bacterium]|nr:SDR family oxidoreductase [Mycobacteriales bacterium]
MARYLVTGATGFVGRHLVERLLGRDDAEVIALVRAGSRTRLAELARGWPGGERVTPLQGDLTKPQLGLTRAALGRLTGQVDHFVHLAAIYDLTQDTATNERVNVEGTRRVVEVAARLAVGCLHHVSSVAVAGDHRGRFSEADFDTGQGLPSAYHRTKFEAERLVREQGTVPWRVYRPAIVVGHSHTGAMDKIDGPYYFFPTFRRLAGLPGRLPLVLPEIGNTNIVPVDYVADAMDYLIHEPGLDGRAFHLVAPRAQSFLDVYNAFAAAAGAPRVAVRIGGRAVGTARTLADRVGLGRIVGGLAGGVAALPGADLVADLVVDALGIPAEVLPHLTFPSDFDTAATARALAGSGLRVPELDSYADRLWRYWAEHLDPDRARRRRPGGPLAGRTVIITGASSGIGRAAALGVASAGGVPLLVARRTEALEEVRGEIERSGGRAYVYSCDITQPESVDALLKELLADHEGIDMLVNNAGRSIRRSVQLSYDRFHDYERTMSLNYFGAVRLILGLLPHMSQRRFGHVVNISSIGVQANPPRFSAYVASKAALDAFSKVVASETYGDGITFTTVHMPLVRTPMISPTKLYDAFPAISPDEAADLVLDALVGRPKHIGTKLGTTAEVLYALAPRAVDAVLHVAYRTFPDSAAATGDPAGRPPAATMPRAAHALIRLLPGVHW